MCCTVDPWFNFRATKYLVQNGFYSFWDWFDDRMHLSTKGQEMQWTDVGIQEHGTLSDESLVVRSTPD
jgi:hypothetical protein